MNVEYDGGGNNRDRVFCTTGEDGRFVSANACRAARARFTVTADGKRWRSAWITAAPASTVDLGTIQLR